MLKFPDLDKSPMDVASYIPNRLQNADKLAKVTYSRPQLKGRSLNELFSGKSMENRCK
jgi:hypothetical protein